MIWGYPYFQKPHIFWYCKQFWNDHYWSKIMQERFTHIRRMFTMCVNSPIRVHKFIIVYLFPLLFPYLRQASRAWVRLQPWAVSTLEIWIWTPKGQWLHNGYRNVWCLMQLQASYCTSKWYVPLWSISLIHPVLVVKIRLWQVGAYMTKGLRHS